MTANNLNISFPIPAPTKKNFINLTGQRFGRWLVLAYAGPSKRKAAQWLCLCTCKNLGVVVGLRLRNGRSTSCGCYKAEVWGKQPVITHGECKGGRQTVEYRAYVAAKERCTRPSHPAYANYGGRGIEFRFDNFESFLAEVGRRPSPAHSIDRKDNEGHYEPGNVKWSTALQQNHNRRISKCPE